MLRERIRSKRWAGIVSLLLLLCLGMYFFSADAGSAWLSEDADSAWLSERGELRARPESLDAIRENMRAGPVTFVFAAKELRYNNAVALKEYVEDSE